MSSELFNSITGYSVGIPPTLVVNSSGTILTNVDNDYVTANTVLANIVQSPLTTKASSATGTIGQICWMLIIYMFVPQLIHGKEQH